MDHGGGKIGDKISWDTLPQTTFLTICQIKKGKLSFPSPTPSMQCCATVWATCRKQSTPRLWMEGGGGGRGGIVLFSKVTPVEDNRVVKLHLSFERKTPLCTTWPSFPIYLPFTVHYFYTQISSFTQYFIHMNCFEQFLSVYFLFWEILNLNLTFAVCRIREA